MAESSEGMESFANLQHVECFPDNSSMSDQRLVRTTPGTRIPISLPQCIWSFLNGTTDSYGPHPLRYCFPISAAGEVVGCCFPISSAGEVGRLCSPALWAPGVA